MVDFMECFHTFSLWTFILYVNFVKGFRVNVIQSSYQAEENHSVTLEWMFTTKSDTFITSLQIFCSLITDQKQFTIFFLDHGIEVSESQDEKFSGRVQNDKDALREGCIRLQLSKLRTDDSGLYLCEVKTDDGVGHDRCRVQVSESKPAKSGTIKMPLQSRNVQPPDLNKETKFTGTEGLIVFLVFIILLILGGGCFLVQKCQKQSDTSSSTPV